MIESTQRSFAITPHIAILRTHNIPNTFTFFVVTQRMAISQEHLDQITTLIQNIDNNNKKIPYLQDLQKHPVYGPFFADVDPEDFLVIEEVITNYIKEKIKSLKTKGGEMFRRFYALNQEQFRTFRKLNANEANIESDEFQTIGKELEQQLFKFENILTQNMMKKPQGLDKTISAYYDIVHSFFPLYSRIK